MHACSEEIGSSAALSLLHSLLPFYVPISHMISLSLIITSSLFIYDFSLLTHKITTAACPAAAEDPYPAVKIAREHMIKESYTVEGHSSGWNFLSYWKDLSQ